jgi:hypothetical protein
LIAVRIRGIILEISEGRALEALCGEKVDFHKVAKSGKISTIKSRGDTWWRSTSFGGRVLERKGEGGLSKNS